MCWQFVPLVLHCCGLLHVVKWLHIHVPAVFCRGMDHVLTIQSFVSHGIYWTTLSQVISGKMYSGPEVDVWSCGVILYAMLANSLPFDNANISELFKSIQSASYKVPDHISPGAQDLVVRMLTVDPVKRITIAEIK